MKDFIKSVQNQNAEYDNKFEIVDPNIGLAVSTLNAGMIFRQDCEENLEALKDVHILKQDIYNLISEETNPELLRSYAKDLTEIEFELQRLWKFDLNANFHRFWEAPKCTCPVLDNRERLGYDGGITSKDCPLHGWED